MLLEPGSTSAAPDFSKRFVTEVVEEGGGLSTLAVLRGTGPGVFQCSAVVSRGVVSRVAREEWSGDAC